MTPADRAAATTELARRFVNFRAQDAWRPGNVAAFPAYRDSFLGSTLSCVSLDGMRMVHVTVDQPLIDAAVVSMDTFGSFRVL